MNWCTVSTPSPLTSTTSNTSFRASGWTSESGKLALVALFGSLMLNNFLRDGRCAGRWLFTRRNHARTRDGNCVKPHNSTTRHAGGNMQPCRVRAAMSSNKYYLFFSYLYMQRCKYDTTIVSHTVTKKPYYHSTCTCTVYKYVLQVVLHVR